MLFATLVVTQGLLVLEFFKKLFIDDFLVAQILADPFNLIQQESCIAIGLRDEFFHDGVFDFNILQLQTARVVAQGAKNQRAQVVLAQGRKKNQLAAAKQSAVDLKPWVFGGGAYKRHRAVFDGTQQRILLSLVKAVNFVDKKNRVLEHALHSAGIC